MFRVDKPDEVVRRQVEALAKEQLKNTSPGTEEHDIAFEQLEGSGPGNWVTAKEEQRYLRAWNNTRSERGD